MTIKVFGNFELKLVVNDQANYISVTKNAEGRFKLNPPEAHLHCDCLDPLSWTQEELLALSAVGMALIETAERGHKALFGSKIQGEGPNKA